MAQQLVIIQINPGSSWSQQPGNAQLATRLLVNGAITETSILAQAVSAINAPIVLMQDTQSFNVGITYALNFTSYVNNQFQVTSDLPTGQIDITGTVNGNAAASKQTQQVSYTITNFNGNKSTLVIEVEVTYIGPTPVITQTPMQHESNLLNMEEKMQDIEEELQIDTRTDKSKIIAQLGVSDQNLERLDDLEYKLANRRLGFFDPITEFFTNGTLQKVRFDKEDVKQWEGNYEQEAINEPLVDAEYLDSEWPHIPQITISNTDSYGNYRSSEVVQQLQNRVDEAQKAFLEDKHQLLAGRLNLDRMRHNVKPEQAELGDKLYKDAIAKYNQNKLTVLKKYNNVLQEHLVNNPQMGTLQSLIMQLEMRYKPNQQYEPNALSRGEFDVWDAGMRSSLIKAKNTLGLNVLPPLIKKSIMDGSLTPEDIYAIRLHLLHRDIKPGNKHYKELSHIQQLFELSPYQNNSTNYHADDHELWRYVINEAKHDHRINKQEALWVMNQIDDQFRSQIDPQVAIYQDQHKSLPFQLFSLIFPTLADEYDWQSGLDPDVYKQLGSKNMKLAGSLAQDVATWALRFYLVNPSVPEVLKTLAMNQFRNYMGNFIGALPFRYQPIMNSDEVVNYMHPENGFIHNVQDVFPLVPDRLLEYIPQYPEVRNQFFADNNLPIMWEFMNWAADNGYPNIIDLNRRLPDHAGGEIYAPINVPVLHQAIERERDVLDNLMQLHLRDGVEGGPVPAYYMDVQNPRDYLNINNPFAKVAMGVLGSYVIGAIGNYFFNSRELPEMPVGFYQQKYSKTRKQPPRITRIKPPKSRYLQTPQGESQFSPSTDMQLIQSVKARTEKPAMQAIAPFYLGSNHHVSGLQAGQLFSSGSYNRRRMKMYQKEKDWDELQKYQEKIRHASAMQQRTSLGKRFYSQI